MEMKWHPIEDGNMKGVPRDEDIIFTVIDEQTREVYTAIGEVSGRYRISTDKVRKRLDGSFIYSLDDGDVTIACRDREVAIFQNGNAVRMPLGQLKWLLDMCDEHYDNIKFAVEMYMRANRDEIGTIE